MKNKNVILYSVLAIVFSVGAYYVITSQKDGTSGKSDKKNDDVKEETVTSGTGQQISVEQIKTPKNLIEILNLPSVQASNLLKGKTIFTKLNNTNVRRTPDVNNGILINNIMGKIANSGVNCGIVTAVVDDANGLKKANGSVYKWIKFIVSPQAKMAMNQSKEFLAANIVDSISYTGYLREDTINI